MRLFSLLITQLITSIIVVDAAAKTRLVNHRDSHLQYMGRVKINTDNAELYWSGSSVKLSFTGSSVKAILKDEKANNFYQVIVDDSPVIKLKLDTGKASYALVENLKWGRHTIELNKCTEWDRGKTLFYGFETDAKKLFAPAHVVRRMEFFGNSITCGFGVEDSLTDSGVSKYENNYLSYASITARHYKSQYHCIAKSGIGFMVSFARLTMPEMYNRLNPADSLSSWDFTKYKPDVVIVDVGENDAAIVTRPDNPQFIRVFGNTPPKEDFIVNSYASFIRTLRTTYPDAYIICTLGSMGSVKEGSQWPGYIAKAAATLNDSKVSAFFFHYKGSAGHPKIKDHKMMADDLSAFIDKTVKW